MSGPINNPNLIWDEENQVFRGKFIVGQDNDIVFKVKRDKTINEGNETFNISLQNIDQNNTDVITGKSVNVESVKEKSVDIIDSSKQLIFNLSIIPSSALSSGLSEPQNFSILLQVDNLEEGFDSFTIPYVIETAPSGGTIDVSDFSLLPGNNLNGNFDLDQNGFGRVDLAVSRDYKTEGDEIFRFKLVNNPEVYIDVKIWDTSLTAYFTLEPNLTTINEGQILEIDLITQNVGSNVPIPFTISGTGITLSDFSNPNKTLTEVGGDIKGSFLTDFAGNDTFRVTLSEDRLTESNEIMNFSLDNGKDDVDITIVSTSNTPSYSSITGPSSVTEGSSFTYYLKGQNMLSGETSAQWQIQNITSQNSDFVSTSGNFTINSNTSQSFSVQIANDGNYEYPYETFKIVVTVDGQQISSNTITINDSADAPSITGFFGPSEVYEGQTYTYSVTGQNMTNGPRYGTWYIDGPPDPYGIDEAEIPGDFDGSTSGTFYVNNNTSNGFSITIKDDLIREDNDEFFIIYVGLDYSSGTGMNDAYWGSTKTVKIKPSDQPVPSYTSLQSAVMQISEGNSLQMNLSGQNMTWGPETGSWEILHQVTVGQYERLTNSSDFDSTSGTFNINNDDNASFFISIKDDGSTDESYPEKFRVRVNVNNTTLESNDITITSVDVVWDPIRVIRDGVDITDEENIILRESGTGPYAGSNSNPPAPYNEYQYPKRITFKCRAYGLNTRTLNTNQYGQSWWTSNPIKFDYRFKWSNGRTDYSYANRQLGPSLSTMQVSMGGPISGDFDPSLSEGSITVYAKQSGTHRSVYTEAVSTNIDTGVTTISTTSLISGSFSNNSEGWILQNAAYSNDYDGSIKLTYPQNSSSEIAKVIEYDFIEGCTYRFQIYLNNTTNITPSTDDVWPPQGGIWEDTYYMKLFDFSNDNDPLGSLGDELFSKRLDISEASFSPQYNVDTKPAWWELEFVCPPIIDHKGKILLYFQAVGHRDNAWATNSQSGSTWVGAWDLEGPFPINVHPGESQESFELEILENGNTVLAKSPVITIPANDTME